MSKKKEILNVVPLSIKPASEIAARDVFGPAVVNKRGPKRKKLARTQMGEFLHLLHQGHGRTTACFLVQMSYRLFLRQLREDKAFADSVREAEAIRLESCESMIYRLAVGPADTPIRLRAAIAYLGRRDKIKESLRARAEKAGRSAKTEK